MENLGNGKKLLGKIYVIKCILYIFGIKILCNIV